MIDPKENIAYRLKKVNGRLVIADDRGRIFPWACYGLSSAGKDIDTWKRLQLGFLRSGVKLFQICVWPSVPDYFGNPFFPSSDAQDYNEANQLEMQARYLLEREPDARFIVRFSNWPTPAWRKENPGELQMKEGGTGDQSCVNPSLASDKYLEAVKSTIRKLVKFCESREWHNHVIGYSIFPYAEGLTENSLSGYLFDESPVMQQAFAKHVKAKYKTTAALRKAWQDPKAKIDTVRVPSQAEWVNKKRHLNIPHWPDPAMVRRERDYFELQKKLFHRYCKTHFRALDAATRKRPVIKGYDMLKQPLQGWMHDVEFWAENPQGDVDHYASPLLVSGSLGVGELLDEPGLDILQTPGVYYYRAMGHTWESEGLTDSLTLRGKLNFTEADMRTWADGGVNQVVNEKRQSNQGSFLIPAEMRAGFDRTLSWALSRNQMYYYMSVSRFNNWYEHPLIEKHIEQQKDIIDASTRWNWSEEEGCICVVIDDEASLHEDFSSGYQNLAITRQIHESLALCGIPYRLHLLSDLRRSDFPKYKCYYFPNLFKLDRRTEEMLREKVLCRGRLSIFAPGTAITDGRKYTPETGSRLLGVDMELIQKSSGRRSILEDRGHAISRGLETQTFGDSYAYGPILAPRAERIDSMRDRVNELGSTFYYFFYNRPGLFIKEHGRRGRADHHHTLFSAALPMPPELFREIGRYAGCHVYSEENAVVHACSGFLGIHSSKRGELIVKLPANRTAWDVHSGKSLSTRRGELKLKWNGAQTRLMRLEKS